MVLSLFDSCMVAIRDGIADGLFLQVHVLPPHLRQPLLDMILMQGMVNSRQSLTVLGSADFLRGFSTFSTQRGTADDRRYLAKIAKAMDSILPSGQPVGGAICDLQLNIYGQYQKDAPGVDTNVDRVAMLISTCSNLKSLNLRLAELPIGSSVLEPSPETGDLRSLRIFDWHPPGGGLLNSVEAFRPCISIIERLQQLTLNGCSFPPILVGGYPIIEFKNLASLHLTDAKLDGDAWLTLLTSVQGSLSCLRLEKVGILDTSGNRCVLPIALPHLRSLKVDGDRIRCMRLFVENVLRCSSLKYMFLMLDAYTDLEDLDRLTQFQATMDVKVDLSLWHHIDDDVFDGSRFRLITLFGQRVRHFKLSCDRWSAKFTSAFTHVIDECQNLASISLTFPLFLEDTGARRELEAAKSKLICLVGDTERASKLRHVSLFGEFNQRILQEVFQNCLNLDSLSISVCPQLKDEHFIKWARRGVRLAKLRVEDCGGISDDGLVPLLISCGEKLTSFVVSSWSLQSKVTDRTWRAMIDHCRWIRRSNIPKHLREVLRSKCFYSDV